MKFMQMLKSYHNRGIKVKQITLVWTCTENGTKQNSQKGVIYEFGTNKTERQTKKQMAKLGERGRKGSWWRRVAGKNTQQRGMEEAPENGKDRAFCTCQSNEWCNIPKH